MPNSNENKNINRVRRTNGKRREFIEWHQHPDRAPISSDNPDVSLDVGSKWYKLDDSTVYECIFVDPDTGDATWVEVTGGGGGGDPVPPAASTQKIPSTQFVAIGDDRSGSFPFPTNPPSGQLLHRETGESQSRGSVAVASSADHMMAFAPIPDGMKLVSVLAVGVNPVVVRVQPIQAAGHTAGFTEGIVNTPIAVDITDHMARIIIKADGPSDEIFWIDYDLEPV